MSYKMQRKDRGIQFFREFSIKTRQYVVLAIFANI